MNNFKIFIAIVSLLSINYFAYAQKHWESLVIESDTFNYLVPQSEPAADWNQLNFDDTGWTSNVGGFGYGDNDDNTILETPFTSLYLRKKINIPANTPVSQLVFDIDYDDAFVAYINGQEVARSQNLQSGTPTFDAAVLNDHEASMYSGGSPESYSLDASLLNEGDNILAVHVLNLSITSSDFSARVFLSAEIDSDEILFHPTPNWFQEPVSYESSNLPIVKIYTNGQTIPDEPKITANMKVINNANGINRFDDTNYEYDGYIGIEIRGNTAQMFDKKSYTIETRLADGENNNVELLGFPKENDWVFYGPYSDKSLMRNALAYHIGDGMGKGWHPRTRFVEMTINDEYTGIYMFTEKIKIDKNRVDLATLKPEDNTGNEVTGGYIISIDRDQDGSWNSPFMGRTGSVDIPFSYVDPKYDELTDEQREYIKNYIINFEVALDGANYKDPEEGYRAYIDVVSFIDYFIITELSKDLDGYRVSVYFHKDKDSKDGRLKMTPFWDYNLCFGNADFFDAGFTEGWASDGIGAGDWYEIPFWWDKFRTDPYFESLLKWRWKSLRQEILAVNDVNSFIDSVALLLDEAQVRNFTKHDILSSIVWPNNYVGGTYENEVGYLKNWLGERITWLDSQINPINDVNFEKPTIETLSVSNASPNATILNGNVTGDGESYVWERGFYYSAQQNPVENGKKAKAGKGSGAFDAQVGELLPNTTYNYVAYAKNDIGTTYGNEVSFTTSATGIMDNIFSEYNVKAYPNPFSNQLAISINLNSSGNLAINIIDLMGKVIEQQSMPGTSGLNKFMFNANTFERGGNIYFYEVVFNNSPVYRGKLIKK